MNNDQSSLQEQQQQLAAQQTQAFMQSPTRAQLIQQQLIQQQQKRLQQQQLSKSNIALNQNRINQHTPNTPLQQQQHHQQQQQQFQHQPFIQKNPSFPTPIQPSNTPPKRPSPSFSDALGPNTALLRAKRSRPTDRSLPIFEPADPKAPRYSLDGLKPERMNNMYRMAKNYEKLQKVEQEFDWVISRKRFEIEDLLRKPNPVQRTLRIKVWNTTSNQSWQQNQSSTQKNPPYKKNERISQPNLENPDQDGNRDRDQGDNDDGDQQRDDDREKSRVEENETESNTKGTPAPASSSVNAHAHPNFASGEGIPKWTLHLQGHLMGSNHSSSPPTRDDGMSQVEPSQAEPAEVKIEETPRPLATLLNSVMIKVDRPAELYAEPNIIEWHRPTGGAGSGKTFSTISVTRNGSEDCPVQIALHLNHFPQRFKLDPTLGHFLDIKEGSLDDIFEAIWCYIKKNKLIDSGVDKRLIRKDAKLACLFPPSVDRMPFHQISEQVRKFLSIPEPAIIPFEVKVDKENQSRAEYFDIQLSIEDPAKLHFLNIKNQIEDNNLPANSTNCNHHQGPNPVNFTKEILALDEQIMDSILKIREVKIRRDFYKKFTLDPVRFIEEWIESQSKDLDVLLGLDRGTEATSVNYDVRKRMKGIANGLGVLPDDGVMVMGLDYQKRFSDFYNRKWVEDAIKIYQSREFNQKVQNQKSNNNQMMMINNNQALNSHQS